MAELEADLGAGVGMDEIDDALERRLVLRLVHAAAARGNASFGPDAGHLDEEQAGPALGAGAPVNQVEVVGRAVLGAVHRHRRDHYPVHKLHVTQAERREHRRDRLLHRFPAVGVPGEPPLHVLEPVLVAQAQVLVADALAAGQEPVVELHRLLLDVAGDVLEPLGAVARRTLQLEHRGTPLFLVVLQRGPEIVALVQLLGEPYRVLQSQLRARADGEVGGVGGVSHQHDVVVEPVLVADAREVAPRRLAEVVLVVDQGVAVEVGLEDLLHKRDALVGPELVEAQALPGLRRALDYAGASVFVEAVGVDPGPTGPGLLEREGEGVKDLVGAEPDELVGPQVHVRFKLFLVELPYPTVYPIAGNDEVRIPELAEVLNLPLEPYVYPEIGRPLRQDVQQLLAAYPHEPMSAGATDAL